MSKAMREPERPEIRPGRSSPDGGCNGCDTHIGEFGMRGHRVAVLQLRGMQVRLCPACARLVVTALKHYIR